MGKPQGVMLKKVIFIKMGKPHGGIMIKKLSFFTRSWENHRAGWLVGCFGFDDTLRQYFSLYRAVSQKEGEIEENILNYFMAYRV